MHFEVCRLLSRMKSFNLNPREIPSWLISFAYDLTARGTDSVKKSVAEKVFEVLAISRVVRPPWAKFIFFSVILQKNSCFSLKGGELCTTLKNHPAAKFRVRLL